MKHRHSLTISFALCAALLFVSSAYGDPITGVPSTPSPAGYVFPSTNALNYAEQTPFHVGQVTPYVIFNSNAVGQVTLDFKNAYAGVAFFEYRIDQNVLTSGDAHPIVTGDFIYDGIFIGTPLATATQTFSATDMVEIRLALGGERDWDFDWVAFKVLPSTSVPEPSTLLLLGSGLLGLVGYGRRRLKK